MAIFFCGEVRAGAGRDGDGGCGRSGGEACCGHKLLTAAVGKDAACDDADPLPKGTAATTLPKGAAAATSTSIAWKSAGDITSVCTGAGCVKWRGADGGDRRTGALSLTGIPEFSG